MERISKVVLSARNPSNKDRKQVDLNSIIQQNNTILNNQIQVLHNNQPGKPIFGKQPSGKHLQLPNNQNLINVSSKNFQSFVSDYSNGVSNKCAMHTHSRGWKINDGVNMRNSQQTGQTHCDRRSIVESKQTFKDSASSSKCGHFNPLTGGTSSMLNKKTPIKILNKKFSRHRIISPQQFNKSVSPSLLNKSISPREFTSSVSPKQLSQSVALSGRKIQTEQPNINILHPHDQLKHLAVAQSPSVQTHRNSPSFCTGMPQRSKPTANFMQGVNDRHMNIDSKPRWQFIGPNIDRSLSPVLTDSYDGSLSPSPKKRGARKLRKLNIRDSKDLMSMTSGQNGFNILPNKLQSVNLPVLGFNKTQPKWNQGVRSQYNNPRGEFIENLGFHKDHMSDKLEGSKILPEINIDKTPSQLMSPKAKKSALMNKFENKLRNARQSGVDFEEATSECASPEVRQFRLQREFEMGEFLEFNRNGDILSPNTMQQNRITQQELQTIEDESPHDKYLASPTNPLHKQDTQNYQEEILKNPLAEQFFQMRPKESRISLGQQKEIYNTFYHVDENKISNDPLLLALANIRNVSDKSSKIEQNKEENKVAKMIDIFLNRNQTGLLRTIGRKLNAKVFSKVFQEVADGEDSIIKKFSQELRDKRTYMELCRNAVKPCVQKMNEDNYIFQFFENCKKKKVAALPILFKITEKRLRLDNYTLSSEQCKSLAEICHEFGGVLEKVNLNKNGIRDQDMATLIEAFGEQNRFNSLIIKHNDFGSKSLEQLLPILERGFARGLNEIRIVSCQTTSKVMSELLAVLAENSNVNKLGLVEAKLNCLHIEDIKRFITSSVYLKELDLSWNALGTKEMLDLTSILAENQTLTYVNLSWNYLTHSETEATFDNNWKTELKEFSKTVENEQARKIVEAILEKQDLKWEDINLEDVTKDNFEEKLPLYMAYLDAREHLQSPEWKVHNEKIVANITKMIKRNKKLLHLNLDQTQLTEWMLFHICKSLTRSISVLALHCSGNPGITVNLKEYLWRRIRAKDPHIKKHKVDVDPITKKTTLAQLKQLDTLQKQKRIQECTQVRENKKKALDDCRMTEVSANHHVRTLVFTRILGHKNDIPGSGQWQLMKGNEKCWVCENWIYCIFFWSKKTGAIADQSTLSMVDEMYVQRLDEIYQEEGLPKLDIKTPTVISPHTNWMPKQMYEMKKFCYQIDKKYLNYVEEMRACGEIRSEILTTDDLNPQERRKLEVKENTWRKENYNTYESVSKVIQQRVPYKNCHIVDIQLINDHDELFYAIKRKKEKKLAEQTENSISVNNTIDIETISVSSQQDKYPPVYAYPCFLKPGRQTFLVGDERGNFYVHKFVAPQRIDYIPEVEKEIKVIKKVRTFNKKSSIFYNWIEDTPELTADWLAHDMELWKLKVFVKEVDEQNKIIELMKQHGEYLKNIFLTMASHSNFPQITHQYFIQACAHWGIMDKQFLNSALVGLDLTSACTNQVKFEPVKRIQGQLTRFEFMETLVRLSITRFVKSHQISSPSEAFSTFIEDYLHENYQEEPWNYFRTEKLWTVDMDDLFKANKANCEALLKKFHTPMKVTFTKKDAQELMLSHIDLGIVVDHVNYAAGMCQMTIAKETKAFQMYDDLRLVEFMEFIARVAELRCPGDEFPLTIKVKELCVVLFDVVNKTFVDSNCEVEEESQSDDEY